MAGYAAVANSGSIADGPDAGVLAVPGDIGERATAEQVVGTALDRFGRVDTLINTAGIFIGEPFLDYTDEDLHRIVDVNLVGSFNVTRLAIIAMLARGQGHVVQITTTLVEQPLPAVPPALAALIEGGLAAVTRDLAIEHASRGIRVDAVAPGVIETPMNPPEVHDVAKGLHPTGRIGEIEDAAIAGSAGLDEGRRDDATTDELLQGCDAEVSKTSAAPTGAVSRLDPKHPSNDLGPRSAGASSPWPA